MIVNRDLAETESESFAARSVVGFAEECEDSSDPGEVDGVVSDHWRVEPDVAEGEAGELAGPAEGERTPAQDRQGLVTTVEGAVEAFVTALPDPIDRSDTVGFPEHLVKVDLKRSRFNEQTQNTPLEEHEGMKQPGDIISVYDSFSFYRTGIFPCSLVNSLSHWIGE